MMNIYFKGKWNKNDEVKLRVVKADFDNHVEAIAETQVLTQENCCEMYSPILAVIDGNKGKEIEETRQDDCA